MAVLLSPLGFPWFSWRGYRDLERTWFYMCAGLFVLTGFCLLAGALDDRLFNGVSVWSKPFKFALSLAVYFDPAGVLPLLYQRLPRTTAGRILVVSLLNAGAEMATSYSRGIEARTSTLLQLFGLMYSLGFGAAW